MLAAASLFFFLVAQDNTLSFSGCIGWVEGALKRHVRNSNGDVALEVSSVSTVFFLVCSAFRDGWPIDHAEKLGLRPPCFFLGATAGVRCAMVRGRGVAIAPVASRRGSHFIASTVVTEAAKNHPRAHRGC